MELWKHFTINTILAIVFFPIIGTNSLLFYLTGFFIDIDHWLNYYLKTKRTSLIEAYWFSKNGKELDPPYSNSLHLFHTIEPFIILFALTLMKNQIGMVLLAGWLIHISMDLTWTMQYGCNWRREKSVILFIAKSIGKK